MREDLAIDYIKMACKKCKTKPVIKLPNSNVKLCRNDFIRYFEKKVVKTIGKYKLIERGDYVGIAVSGGKDSTALLYILNKLSKKKNFKIVGIAIDEGIKGYRDKTLKDLKDFCRKEKINLKIYSFKGEFKTTLDKLVKKERPCTICGVLRRTILNKKAKELGVNKLATGHNLDDEAQSILMNQFRSNIKLSARLGPITGVVDDKRFIRRIKPLYFLTEKETTTYAYLKGFIGKYIECPYEVDSYRASIRDMLNEFEEKYPGTKHNIINSFLGVLPLLKKEYTGEIKSCKECGEPCSQEICQACKLVKNVK